MIILGRKLPIPYHYCILIALVLGLVFGAKTYIAFIYWNETSEYIWQRYALPHIINFTFWGFLVPIVFYFVHRFPLYNNPSRKTIVKALSIGVLVAMFHEIFSNVVWFLPMHLIGLMEFTEREFNMVLGALPSALISRIFEYWIIYMIFLALDFYKKYKNKAIELAQTESQLANAKLSALQLQLQPHFLFNTLNTISSLMDVDTKAAQKMVMRLGDLLRSLLDQNKRNKIPLSDELDFIKNYLNIEQVRFQDRLTVAYDIDDNALQALVPSLLLQPLVENAFKHGFSYRTDSGLISVSAKRLNEDLLELRVKDDGEGTNQPVEQLLEKSIGLKNVKERLMQLYPDQYIFRIVTNKKKGFEVIINIPHENH